MNIEQVFEQVATDEVCPCCGEELTISASGVQGQVDVECRCGCSLAVA